MGLSGVLDGLLSGSGSRFLGVGRGWRRLLGLAGYAVENGVQSHGRIVVDLRLSLRRSRVGLVSFARSGDGRDRENLSRGGSRYYGACGEQDPRLKLFQIVLAHVN